MKKVNVEPKKILKKDSLISKMKKKKAQETRKKKAMGVKAKLKV